MQKHVNIRSITFKSGLPQSNSDGINLSILQIVKIVSHDQKYFKNNIIMVNFFLIIYIKLFSKWYQIKSTINLQKNDPLIDIYMELPV